MTVDSRRRWPPSPPWSLQWRLWALTAVVALLAVFWWSVRQFTTIVVTAVLMAYMLDPVIRPVQGRLRLRRSHATLLVYSVVGVLLVVAATILTPVMARGVVALQPDEWQSAAQEFVDRLPMSLVLFERRLDLQPVYQALEEQAQHLQPSLVGRDSVVWLLGIATDFAFTVLGLFFTLVLSIYLAMDSDRFLAWIDARIPVGYHEAYHAIRREVGDVWQAFFRGQLVLVAVIAAATTAGLLILGVRHALWLGLIAGALEVVPRVGPVLSVVPAVIVSAVQPSTTFPNLPRPWYVLSVVLLYVVIQQLENNLLVPRIIGARVRLPAAAVLVGALLGASLAGVVGLLLAPPIIGSLRVVGSWLLAKIAGDDDAGESGGPPRDVGPIDTEPSPEAAPYGTARESLANSPPASCRLARLLRARSPANLPRSAGSALWVAPGRTQAL